MPTEQANSFIAPYADVGQAVDVFSRVFQGRADAYALQHSDGTYAPVLEPLSREIIARHLSGAITVGLYLITPVENTCSLVAIDVDHRSKSMALKLVAACRRIGCTDRQYLFESSGKKGFHVWFMLDSPRPAWTAIRFAETICREAGLLGQVEIFPKQQRVPEGGFGNLIKLPGMHRETRRYSRFFTPDIQPASFEVLSRVQPVDRGVYSAAVDRAREAARSKKHSGHALGSLTPDADRELPCISRILDGVGEGRRNTSGFLLALHLKRSGLPAEFIRTNMETWNTRNRPPLSAAELHALTGRALQPRYPGFRCNSADIQAFCDPKNCPRSTHTG